MTWTEAIGIVSPNRFHQQPVQVSAMNLQRSFAMLPEYLLVLDRPVDRASSVVARVKNRDAARGGFHASSTPRSCSARRAFGVTIKPAPISLISCALS